MWKNGVHLAYVYQDREYTAAKDLNFRYDDDSLLNPIIKEVETNATYSIFDDEYKEKLERACQEAVKCNKVLKMTDHERNFNIAMKLARENRYVGPVAEFMIISDESYRRGEDIRLAALENCNAVQPFSSSKKISGDPSFIIGSMAKVIPGFSFGPREFILQFGISGGSWRFRPIPCPTISYTTP